MRSRTARRNRPLRLGIAAVAAFLLALTAHPGVGAELDRVAAVVNGDVILESDIKRRFRHLVFDYRSRATPLPSQDALVRRSLDELILERLQLRIADRLDIRASGEEVNRTIVDVARRNDVSVDGLRRSLAEGGIPIEEFAARIQDDLRIDKVRRQEVYNRIQISEAEVDRYLAQPDRAPENEIEYLLGHILVPRSDDEAAARGLAEELLARLQAGEDFATLARRHSSGGRASDGGTLGWRTASDLPSLFAEVVPQIDPGATSGIIENPSGFHIIRVYDSRRAGQSFVRQTHAAHILAKVGPLVTDDSARMRLERLRERILFGEDLGELARFHSDDTTSAVRGGDLGWLNPGDAAGDIEAVMNELEEGELSEPFKSSWGWHILRVLARRDHDNTNEVRRAQARNAIFRRRAQETLTDWLGQLRDRAFIRIHIRLGE